MVDEQTPSAGGSTPRYASLDDYLNVIRRRKWIIVALVVVGTLGGIAFALSRTETYTASTSVSFRDISQDLRSIGADALPETAPQALAAINAELLTRPEVTRRVQRELDDEASEGQLVSAVNARVATNTGLVVVEATTQEPELAARIANAYAEQAQKVGTREVRRRLNQVIEVTIDEIEELRSSGDRAQFGIRMSILESQLGRVQTLRDIAQPVQIARPASVPSRPNTAGPLSSAVIGGLLGLVLGLIAGFTRDALDKRLRTPHEVHKELGLPVLGRVHESALGFAGLVRPEGGEAMWDSDFEAFRALRNNLSYLGHQNGAGPVRCLLVTSGLASEGKSTVSVALASAAAAAGQRVLLIEGDLRRPCFAARLGTAVKPGLCDYLRGGGALGPTDIVRTVDLSAARSSKPTASHETMPRIEQRRLACIVAGEGGSDSAELLLSERFGSMIESVRRAYDLVVIDSSPMLAVADPLQLAKHVDAVLVCVRVHASTRDEVRALRSVLSTLPSRPSSAVVTGLRRGGADSYEYYYGY